jgi:hypothetical protein
MRADVQQPAQFPLGQAMLAAQAAQGNSQLHLGRDIARLACAFRGCHSSSYKPGTATLADYNGVPRTLV